MAQAVCDKCGKRGDMNYALPDCLRDDCPATGFQRAINEKGLFPVLRPGAQAEIMPTGLPKVITECRCDPVTMHSASCPSYTDKRTSVSVIEKFSVNLWNACYAVRKEKDFMDAGGMQSALMDLFALMRQIDLEVDEVNGRRNSL